ncbi:hypothetical protein M405DRAFT_692046, partial [Rhizopogon salebrosus TDB-379]
LAEDLDFKDMVYVNGAGRDTSKRCLPGTREDILKEIKDWIYQTGEDVKRVFWLSGTAGKGKSAIAHTIANWFDERGGSGACFCFDRIWETEKRHEKIFTTIARDLANRDSIMWRALVSAARDNELRHTKDITRQWKKFILGPVDAASQAVDAPVLMSLLGAPHVHHVSMDDISHVSLESSQRDIERYLSDKLKKLGDVFDDLDFQRLAQKSDGLFEWARLACEYIKRGLPPKSRFNALVDGTTTKGTHLLDDVYKLILGESMPEKEHEDMIPVFRSVMRQILVSLEPLPAIALTAMRQHFPCEDERFDVKYMIGQLGSLVTGTDFKTPIRPLHASFYDFLTDKSRSNEYFVNKISITSDLAFASLRVMEKELRFNICCLESSYLPNSAVRDL